MFPNRPVSIIHFDILTPLFFELSSKKKKIHFWSIISQTCVFFMFEDNSKTKGVKGVKMYYGQLGNMGF